METNKIDFSPGYKIRNQKGVHFLIFQVVYWIDIFSRRRYRDILIESLKYCQKEKELKVHAYVIMTNHVHIILSSGKGMLSDTIRDFKTHTSKKIISSVQEEGESRRDWMLRLFEFSGAKNKKNSKYQFWTQENHPIELETNYFFDQKLDYIHNNPVEAGIVDKAEDYLYSSARDYAG